MSLIKNKAELATNELRRCALDILEVGLEAINTEKILRNKLKLESDVLHVEGESFDLQNFKRIFFVGIGKCALEGARVVEDVLGDKLMDGAVIDVKNGSLKKIKVFEGTHPYLSEQNILATKEILKMVEGLTEKDLVITLVSGGGSALFELPTISLSELIQKTNELTAKGADIYELNKFRTDVSQVKGGKFAKLVYPAQMISLIFSDVLGNDLKVVASGPTILEEEEKRVKNILICSNQDALNAMKEKAESLGFNTNIESAVLSGNARDVGKDLASKHLNQNSCLLFGGETTVEIKGGGVGGRNQELALSALSYMQPGVCLVAASSDGWDNTDHAGALVDFGLLEKADNAHMNPKDFLERNDSYNFFKQMNDGAISTDRLGSNVSDLVIIVKKN